LRALTFEEIAFVTGGTQQERDDGLRPAILNDRRTQQEIDEEQNDRQAREEQQNRHDNCVDNWREFGSFVGGLAALGANFGSGGAAIVATGFVIGTVTAAGHLAGESACPPAPPPSGE